ncbi:hypothetical protein GE061_012698, partial [Apolygus lucorum]
MTLYLLLPLEEPFPAVLRRGVIRDSIQFPNKNEDGAQMQRSTMREPPSPRVPMQAPQKQLENPPTTTTRSSLTI